MHGADPGECLAAELDQPVEPPVRVGERADRGPGVAAGQEQVPDGGQHPPAGSVGLLRAQRRMVSTPP